MKSVKPRGGVRIPGAGKKLGRKPALVKAKRYNIYLTDPYHAHLKAIDRNLSRAIRTLVDKEQTK